MVVRGYADDDVLVLGNDIARSLAPAARAWQQQLIDPHDAIDPLMVNPYAALAVELSVKQCGHPPIAVTCALRHERADQRQQPLVVGTRTVAPSPWGRLLELRDQI
jgi:hypothetical protein